jgi:hypothetical protein
MKPPTTTRIDKQQARLDAFVKASAKQLVKMIEAKDAAILRATIRHDEAIHDWWCTIPDGMRPLIEKAAGLPDGSAPVDEGSEVVD